MPDIISIANFRENRRVSGIGIISMGWVKICDLS